MNHLNLACRPLNPDIQAEGQGAKPDVMPGPQDKTGGMVPEMPGGENGDGAGAEGAPGAAAPGEENWLLEQVSANPVMWTLGIVGAAWLLMGRK